MATENCTIDDCGTLQNFGRPVCAADFGRVVGLDYYPRGAGQFQTTQLTYTNLIAEYFADQMARVYPLTNVKNGKIMPSDDTFETTEAGEKTFALSGLYSVTGEIWDEAGVVLAGKLQSLRCNKWSFCPITEDNGRIYELVEVASITGAIQVLIPVRFNEKSLSANFNWKAAGTNAKIPISFDIDRDVKMENLWIIYGDKIHDAPGVPNPIDFINPPKIVDCVLTIESATSDPGGVTALITINTQYRNGQRVAGVDAPGNISGFDFNNIKGWDVELNVINPAVSADETFAESGQYLVTFADGMNVGDRFYAYLTMDSTNATNYSGKTTTVELQP